MAIVAVMAVFVVAGAAVLIWNLTRPAHAAAAPETTTAKAATTKVAPKTAVKAAEKAPDTDSENLTDEEFAAKYGK